MATMRNRSVGVLLTAAVTACGSSASQSTVASDASVPADTSTIDSGGADGSAADVSDPTVPDAPSDAAPSTPEAAPGDGAAPDTASDGGTMMTVYVTFYGWADNSPPGDAIAYPTIHSAAGGTGTYPDPITFATDRSEFAPGTILYVPFIEKYVVMEDDCVDCDSEWKASQKWHIDLWMNSSAAESASALTACENQWTRRSTDVEVLPPPDRLATTRPLFDPSANACRSSP